MTPVFPNSDDYDPLRHLRGMLDNPLLKAFSTNQDTYRKLTDNPLLKALETNQETYRSLADNPLLKALETNQETYRSLADNPMLKAFEVNQESHRKLTDNPLLKAFAANQDRYQAMLENPMLKAFEANQESYRKLTDNPLLKAFEVDQETYRSLTDNPALKAFQVNQEQYEAMFKSPAWPELAGEFAEQVDTYTSELADELDALAATVDTEAPKGATAEDFAALLGFESVRILLWRLKGLLRLMEAVSAATATGAWATGVELPGLLLCLLVMFISTTELLFYVVEGPPDE